MGLINQDQDAHLRRSLGLSEPVNLQKELWQTLQCVPLMLFFFFPGHIADEIARHMANMHPR